MDKKIKKSIRIISVTFGCLILILFVLGALLSLPSIQTYVLNHLSGKVSESIKSSISVGRVEFSYFNRLRLNDLLIKDKNNDTLLYVEQTTIRIRRANLKNNSFIIGRAVVTNPIVAFITDSTGVNNLKWYLDFLKNPEDTVKKDISVRINHVDINKGRFALIKRNAKEAKIPIDFNDLHLSGINGIMEDFVLESDSLSFSVYNLMFRESTGFNVRKMSGDIHIKNRDIIFSDAEIYSESSFLDIEHFGLLPGSTGTFNDFINKVRLDLLLAKSLISSTDLQFFIPALSGINESVNISGKILGPLAELRGRNIEMTYKTDTKLDCDFDLSGLPDIDNTFMYIGVNNFNLNTNDISNLDISKKDKISLPEFFKTLGSFSFNGSFTGFTTDFVTYGKIISEAGNINTDVSFRPENQNNYKLKGLVRGNNIALGLLTDQENLLGKLSMSANIDITASLFKEFSGDITGLIDSVEVNGYKYRNIGLNGILSEKTWDGSVNISEENIKMDLLGMFNFRDELPEFNFTLNLAQADLFRLNLVDDSSASVSMLLTANFRGNNIDNLDGEIKLLNSNIGWRGNNLEFYDFSLKTYTENNISAINLKTDYVDANLRGQYNFTGLVNSVKSALSVLMPSRFSEPPGYKNTAGNRFNFDIQFKNTDKINDFFNTGFALAANSTISGYIAPDSIMTINGNAKALGVNSNLFQDLTMKARYTPPVILVEITSESFSPLGQSELKGLSVNLSTEPDNFILSIDWDNHEDILNNGKIIARGTYINKTPGKEKAVLNIDIDSTSIFSRNNHWKIDNSTITIDTSAIKVGNLNISNNENFYRVNGSLTENPADTLHLEFKGIDLTFLNYFTNKKDDPDNLSLNLRGKIDGNIFVTDIYHNALLESNLKIEDFYLLQSSFGDIEASSVWNNTSKVADIHVFNNLNGQKMFEVDGTYDPEYKEMDLIINTEQLPVDALNPLLKVFASDINGKASGILNFNSSPGKLQLKGAILAENTSMQIDYLQTKYSFTDSIRFDNNVISFNNITLYDVQGNTATLNGSVFHNNFKDYGTDLLINMNECMVLNTKYKDNEVFYGSAFASGVTTIKSKEGILSFDISARTGEDTKINIPLNSSETVSDYSFITFIKNDTTLTVTRQAGGMVNPVQTRTGMDLNFDLEVTPDAEVQLIFDSKVGDIMKGYGTGRLNINYDSKGDFRISGDYLIEAGDYLFTLGNILNKPFIVENGGRIVFNGNIDDAEIDMKAIYKLRASLFEILQDDRFNERIPVECQINLSGKLFNPVISLDIVLPTADEATRTYLKNVITTEEELSRQFLYLLVMNSFYADPSYGSTLTTTTTTGTSAMAVTTTEMVSNQLSNWLSQISNDFDIGFVYRPGYKDINANEVQLALSTQLLNDKVTINGNFDVRGTGGTAGTNDQLTGDFDIEYKITDKIRFKVFNRFNNPYTGKQAPYTQGFGLFYKQDFDKLSDLFRKNKDSEMKKEEEPVVMLE